LNGHDQVRANDGHNGKGVHCPAEASEADAPAVQDAVNVDANLCVRASGTCEFLGDGFDVHAPAIDDQLGMVMRPDRICRTPLGGKSDACWRTRDDCPIEDSASAMFARVYASSVLVWGQRHAAEPEMPRK
jgi:hypothetical protein